MFGTLVDVSRNRTARNVRRSTNNNFRFQALSPTGLQRVQDANNLFTGFFYSRFIRSVEKKIAQKKHVRSRFNVDIVREKAGDSAKNIIYTVAMRQPVYQKRCSIPIYFIYYPHELRYFYIIG